MFRKILQHNKTVLYRSCTRNKRDISVTVGILAATPCAIRFNPFTNCDATTVQQQPRNNDPTVRAPIDIRDKEIAKTIWEKIHTILRYIQRLMTYFLYGAPLVGLVPIAYVFPSTEDVAWDYLVWALVQLGPTFIKFAQWASTRPDVFPPGLIEKLSSLQDDVKISHSQDLIDRTMAKAYGEKWKETLTIDSRPIGTGSVAQVFRGKLKHKGQELDVAVKMIHPDIETLVKIDMELLSELATFIDKFPNFEMLSLGETCRQFAEMMNLQLDLRLEAHNLKTFARKFKEEKWITFPSPIENFITKNVIVETLMSGTPINKYMQIQDSVSESAHKLKLRLSDLCVRMVIKMFFFDNFIHGDLHPGNMLVQEQPNGDLKLVILDCGIVYSSRTEQDHNKLIDICLSFMQHDGRKAARLMIENAPDNSVKNSDEFAEAVQQLVDSALTQSYFEHLGDYIAKMCDLAREHVVRLDPGYFKIAMALKVAEGVSIALDKDLDMVSKCVPIVLKTRSMRAMGLSKFPAPEDDDQVKSLYSR